MKDIGVAGSNFILIKVAISTMGTPITHESIAPFVNNNHRKEKAKTLNKLFVMLIITLLCFQIKLIVTYETLRKILTTYRGKTLILSLSFSFKVFSMAKSVSVLELAQPEHAPR